MNWIQEGTILKGEIVELIPLDEKHFTELDALAIDEKIWEHIPIDMSDIAKRMKIFNAALVERENGNQFPFVIYHKKEKKIIGSTRLMNIVAQHQKLEIGFTWLHPNYWATAVNIECKLLLLTFCFEELLTVRVQLKTDENNIRSRKAIAKIGATYEGILRNEMLRDNGTKRNSVFFSIIDTEWKTAKQNLINLFITKKK